MTLQWVLLTVLLIVIGIISDIQDQQSRISDYATLDSLSRDLLVYRTAITNFAQSNPGFSGIPSDSMLNLPAWFNKPAGLGSYILNGRSYTYFNGVAPSGMPSTLVDLTQSTTVGVNRAGVLVSPTIGATGISIPSAVPEGAIVAFN